MRWTRTQKNVAIAAYLGWTLDAFDFFLTVFVLKDIAAEFHKEVSSVSFALMLTLMLRPLGALIFGRIADRFGRRPTLMINIVCFSILELLSGFSTSLTMFLVMRTLFGIAMGGEWGVGAALTMETVPPKSRGFVSGLLQAGYPSGYLLAAIAYGLLYPHMQHVSWQGYPLGWRTMFFIGVLPALLVVYVRSHVPESPAWQETTEKRERPGLLTSLRYNLKLSIYAIVLMTAFNFFSHGSQDLYPTFLQKQHHLAPETVSWITIVLNIGAIIGGLSFGFISEKIGRRRAIFIASLIALVVVWPWAFSTTPVTLAAGAFLMQISVQGAWGVIPAHLNEISPDAIRATFPGLVYQLGNLFAASNGPLQSKIAEMHGNDYASIMAIVIGIVAIAIAALIPFSPERRNFSMATGSAPAPDSPQDLYANASNRPGR